MYKCVKTLGFLNYLLLPEHNGQSACKIILYMVTVYIGCQLERAILSIVVTKWNKNHMTWSCKHVAQLNSKPAILCKTLWSKWNYPKLFYWLKWTKAFILAEMIQGSSIGWNDSKLSIGWNDPKMSCWLKWSEVVLLAEMIPIWSWNTKPMRQNRDKKSNK